MKLRGAWHVVRHVVRVCGRVANERGTALGGVAVTLWSVPEQEASRLPGERNVKPAEGAVCMLRNQTETRPDGLFYFVDCPSGAYTARALAGGAGASGVASFRLPAFSEGKMELVAADITVFPVAADLADRRS